jgi:HEAT repeat protein
MNRFVFTFAALMLSVTSFAQSQSGDINAKIAGLLKGIRSAGPYEQDVLGGRLVEVIYQSLGVGIDEQTIDLMARLVESGDGHVRVIIARALMEIGPPASLALPSLRKAATEDLELLKQNYGIAIGPETPYEAETRAIEVITGNR